MQLPEQTPAAENAPTECILPTELVLRNILESELRRAPLPHTVRLAQPNEIPIVAVNRVEEPYKTDFTDPERVADVQEMYIQDCARKGARKAWWDGIGMQFQSEGGTAGDSLTLLSGHVLEVMYNGVPLGQTYEVYEVGAPSSKATLDTVYKTLETIDQFTGGGLVAVDKQVRVVLCDGPRLEAVDGEDAKGLAEDEYIGLDMVAVRTYAQEAGTAPDAYISTFLVHELLGHRLEGVAGNGTGEYFSQFFDYSDERVAGDIFTSIHAAITAKDPAHDDSQPVREYGRHEPAEDLATAAESMMIDAMGWDVRRKPKKYEINTDAYRHDLVLQLMQSGAENMAHEAGSPGIVGSEIRYDAHGKARPARTFSITSMSGQEAVGKEIEELVSKYASIKEFVVEELPVSRLHG